MAQGAVGPVLLRADPALDLTGAGIVALQVGVQPGQLKKPLPADLIISVKTKN